ncbi:hypothetical protein H6P81_010870 [Aristolochia fimbriata]|uniref:EF-hand domain-containing protein n=1 Tax=Aristolochia fimbriata TaxID=158543 RepID=A0AAV7EQ01_ARIFI|nr:hypothetical protein H6P81_010870 [Aristolochia fimbriata]
MPVRKYGSGGGSGQKPDHLNSRSEMTVDGFKEWLKQFDADKDGRISKEELREALRNKGFGFLSAAWKGHKGVQHADRNKNGYVDIDEVDSLVALARNVWGMKITVS